ncbi:carboxylesterase [Bryobacterales bacterium F-183]|nr:carboxylesterase [Bryobacterales bacterium F-183]
MLSLALLATASFAAATTPEAATAWPDQYVVANNIRIHYWRTNTPGKPVMILAHGSSDDGMCWTNFAREFAQDYDIIMYDARGHGRSDPPRQGDQVDAQVEDLAGLIKALNIQKPIVMGHSMGASMAIWFGAKYPGVAKAIVLEDPGLVPNPNMAATMNADPAKRMATILEGNNKTVEQQIEWCTKNTKWGLSECNMWAPSKRYHHPNTAIRLTGTRPATAELLPKIQDPVLILKADAKDDVKQQNEKIAALIPRGKIVHITGAGHNVRRENKQMTVDELRAFLKAL